jgi:hypothetical protein
MNSLKINNPCPMTLARVTQGDGTFYCNACSNSIVDFTDKSIDEIKEIIAGKKVCGIFTNDQLNQPKFSLRYKFHYALLTLIAVVGFNVKPINAQSELVAKDTSTNKICPKIQSKSEIKNERQRKINARRREINRRLHPRRRRHVMGCPDF